MSIKKTKTQIIKTAIDLLRQGEVIAFPTETSYGLGCDPRDEEAVKKIYQLKGRPSDKALLLVASSMKQAQEIAEIEGTALMLAKKYWPGALTIILPLKKGHPLAKGVSLKNRVAIRVSSSPFVHKLCQQFKFPIVATSANRSGHEPAYSTKEVINMFGDRVNVVIDGGKLPKRKPSTLVQCQDDGRVDILRQGSFKL